MIGIPFCMRLEIPSCDLGSKVRLDVSMIGILVPAEWDRAVPGCADPISHVSLTTDNGMGNCRTVLLVAPVQPILGD